MNSVVPEIYFWSILSKIIYGLVSSSEKHTEMFCIWIWKVTKNATSDTGVSVVAKVASRLKVAENRGPEIYLKRLKSYPGTFKNDKNQNESESQRSSVLGHNKCPNN
jgi:hypothetical protein